MYYGAIALFWVFFAALVGFIVFLQVRSGDAGSSGISRRRDEHPVAFWIHVGYQFLVFLFVVGLAVYVLYRGPAILK